MYELDISVYTADNEVYSFKAKYNTMTYALNVAQRYVRQIELKHTVVEISLTVSEVIR